MCKVGEEPDNAPPPSMLDAEEYRNYMGSPRNSRIASSVKSKSGENKVEDDDDGISNVQEGERSEMGDAVVR